MITGIKNTFKFQRLVRQKNIQRTLKFMPTCAFLSMDNLENFEVYDDLLHKQLEKLGWAVEVVSWKNNKVNWDNFEAVIIRSTWDYHQSADKFLQVLSNINASSAHLENSLELVEWNINKSYLQDLDRKGIPTIPTFWGKLINKNQLLDSFKYLNAEEIVIKPAISANAHNTFRVKKDLDEKVIDKIIRLFSEREYMIQPFMENIITEGEFSLIYFGGNYSHTILKTPKSNDFRVQEDYGGELQSVDPEPQLKEEAEQIITQIQPQPLFARIDFVRIYKKNFALMELELIEPSLYLNMDPRSPKRFAQAFSERMREKKILQ